MSKIIVYRWRQWWQLYAMMLSICLAVCRLKCVHKNVIVSKTEQFRAMVSINDQ